MILVEITGADISAHANITERTIYTENRCRLRAATVDIRNRNLAVVRFSPLSRGQRLREQTAGVQAFLWRLYRRFFVRT
ncbi:MAG: hypothetical protein IIX33_02780, partial [Oscillospiraceae bacterium]|nr:hypothetical protein [Oscillospiraceae bacterium]